MLDDAAKQRLAENIAGAMQGVSEGTEQRVYEYWTNVDPNLGEAVKAEYAKLK